MWRRLFAWAGRFNVGKRIEAVRADLTTISARHDRHMFYTNVGLITVQWAMAETLIDHANLAVLRCVPDAATLGSELPISFNLKIRRFEDYHRLPALEALSAAGADLAETAKNLKERRHDFVHGLASKALEGGARQIKRSRLKGGNIIDTVKTYTPAQIDRLLDDLEAFVEACRTHMNAVAALVIPQHRSDGLGGDLAE